MAHARLRSAELIVVKQVNQWSGKDVGCDCLGVEQP